MEFIKDLFGFLMKRKKYWLLPLVIVLVLLSVLLILANTTALAPFIYPLF